MDSHTKWFGFLLFSLVSKHFLSVQMLHSKLQSRKFPNLDLLFKFLEGIGQDQETIGTGERVGGHRHSHPSHEREGSPFSRTDS